MRLLRFLLLYLLLNLLSLSLTSAIHPSVANRHIDSLVLMSYNVENLFDTINDINVDDDEFTPDGAKRWTGYRYRLKLNRIARTISSVGEFVWPSIVTLVEVEHAGVIEDLLHTSGMEGKGYKYEVSNSPDPRGIDVAILYRTLDISLLSRAEYVVSFTRDSSKRSRNILECKFLLPNRDTLYIYALHLPSRRGGAKLSEGFRCDALRLLRQIMEKHYANLTDEGKVHTHFIAMGDFNEEANERAMRRVLASSETLPPSDNSLLTDSLKLYSLLSSKAEPHAKRRSATGSYYYQHRWLQLDQFVVSESLLTNRASSTRYVAGSAVTYTTSFLISNRSTFRDSIPFRTYGGSYYIGGYSDHFPIRMCLSLR